MKMTDCNSMLAAPAKTLITSWQTLYWISMKGDTHFEECWAQNLLYNYNLQHTSNQYQCRDEMMFSYHVLSDWRWDESAAVVVKMIWPRYEMMAVSGRQSLNIKLLTDYWLGTLNSQHYNNSSVDWQPRPAKERQKQDPSRYQVAERAVICQE